MKDNSILNDIKTKLQGGKRIGFERVNVLRAGLPICIELDPDAQDVPTPADIKAFAEEWGAPVFVLPRGAGMEQITDREARFLINELVKHFKMSRTSIQSFVNQAEKHDRENPTT